MNEAAMEATLQQHAIDFWLNPAAWIHKSWRETVRRDNMPELPDAVWHKPACSRLLFERFDLEQPENFGFDTPHSRIALLDGESLEKGLLGVAACFHAPSLILEVSGERLRQAQDALGGDAFAYARSTEARIPLAREYAAPFQSRFNSLRIGLWAAGYGFPDEVQFRRRLRLKLPAELEHETLPENYDNIDAEDARVLSSKSLSIFTEILAPCPLLAD